MMQQTVHVELGERSCDVVIGPDLLETAGTRIAPLLARPRVAVLTDETVAALHLDALREGLAADGVTILLITHKLAEIMAVCDAVSVMRRGKMVGRSPPRRAARHDHSQRLQVR